MEDVPEFATELTTALGEGLGVLSDGDAPPSSVSAAEAIRQGRARVRRRRTAAAGAVAAIVVTAGALGSLQTAGGGGPTPGLPAASVSSGPAAPSKLPSPAWSGTPGPGPSDAVPLPTKTVVAYPGKDPLSGMPKFGWLPDSVTMVSYSLQPNGTMLRSGAADQRAGGPGLTLRTFPAGPAPASGTLPAGAQVMLVPAPAVNGREAHWVVPVDQGLVQYADELQWKTADGGWADLNASNLKDEDKQKVPLQVAAGVDTQPHDTPLPVRFTGLPTQYAVSNAVFFRSTTDQKDWHLQLNFSVSFDKYFAVSVVPDGPSASASPTAPGGMPVHQAPHACKTEQGLRICVESMQDPAAVFAAIGGMDAMLPKITALGLDEGNWTTGVIG